MDALWRARDAWARTSMQMELEVSTITGETVSIDIRKG